MAASTEPRIATGSKQQTILLAFDGSQHSEAALAWFARVIDSCSTEQPRRLVIFYSVEAPPLSRGNSTLLTTKTELYAQLMRESATQIDKVRQRTLALCQRLGVRASVAFVDKYEHEPGKAIVAKASDENADLILMGSRGLNRVRKAFLGSVSDYVVHHAHRPVVVVPMDA